MNGVFHVMSTPFTGAEELDRDGIRKLADAAFRDGVRGLLVLGVAGEASKLSEDEQRGVLAVASEVVAGRPMIVGITRQSTFLTIHAGRLAREYGASAVMVAPPTFLADGPALERHLYEVSEAVDLPLVLQDFPASSGVSLSPQAIARLVETVPGLETVKLEGVPTARRTAELRDLVDVAVLGGLGACYLLDELRAGAQGTITGYPFPRVLVEIWEAWSNGDQSRAAELYLRYLPTFLLDAQPGTGLAMRKQVLADRGLIGAPLVRRPGVELRSDEVENLRDTVRRVGLGGD